MSQDHEPFNPFDPTGMFKSMRDSSMDAWSKMMIQFVNTDAYAQATGSILNAWLSSSAPLRKAFDTAMTQALANAHMPSREDVTRLAERLTNIEMRLDDFEAKLDEALRSDRKSSARSRAKPAAAEEHHDTN
jgi:hypothetical protein